MINGERTSIFGSDSDKGSSSAVEARYPPVGRDPERAIASFRQMPYGIAGERHRIMRDMPVDCHRIAIVAIQAVRRPDPDKTTRILKDAVDRVLGKSFVDGNALQQA
jgi:hypothetical protein